MCVGNDDDVRSVAFGDDGALAGLGAGRVLVDHTTASADVARELPPAAESQGAASSTRRSRAARPAPRTASSTIMCGGEPAAFDAGAAGDRRLRQGVSP